MQLAFPLELNRTGFQAHLTFLKDCGVEQVPLYFMMYNEDVTPMAPGTTLDRMLGLLAEHIASIQETGMRSEVLYIDFRQKPADLCGSNEDAQKWFSTLCHKSAQLGIKHIGFFPNNPTRESASPEWDTEQEAGYRFMSRAANEHDQAISVHLNMMAGSRYDTVADIDHLFQSVNEDNFGLLFCFGCVALAQLDLSEMIHHWHDRIFIVHLRDLNGSWAEGYTEEQFGHGRLKLNDHIQALKDIGYTGILHPEHFPVMDCEIPIKQRPLFDHAWDRGTITTAWSLGFWRGRLG